MDKKKLRKYRRETILANVGRDPESNLGIVNPPVYHASTVLFPTLDEYEATSGRGAFDRITYGRIGTPTTWAVEEAVAALEGGDRAISLPSGLAAISCALSAFLSAGDHLLIADNVYRPTRSFCNDVLKRFGVSFDFFDPMIGGGIRDLMKPETRVIFFESPGSITFEVMDVPAVAKAARDHGAVTIMDNTWSAGFYFRPLEHGVDVSLQAGTKYIVGHADTMLGFLICGEAHYPTLKTTATRFGFCAGPDDCYLGLRGLRTLATRMPRHQENGIRLAEWLAGRPEVETVLHPAFPTCPGHETWKRDFTGASGLFGFVLKDYPRAALAAMLDGLELFGMGDSWGGYESLIVPTKPAPLRTATTWPYKTPSLRLHAGLEAFEDLRDDLEEGLVRLNAAV